MDEVLLKMLDFGKSDAKFEAEKSNFTSLFFDDKEYFKRLDEENCFIIYGYKGTGKTMLSNYFSKQKEKDSSVKKMYAGDFIQEKLLSFSRTPIAKEELIIFWKYVYLKQLGRMLTEKINKKPFFFFRQKRKIKKLHSLLNEVQMIVDKTESFIENTNNLSSSSSFTTVPVAKFGFSSSKSSKQNLKSENIRANYMNLIQGLETEVIKNIRKNDEFYMIFDDMDQLEETLERDDFIELTKQMIYSADYFNDMLRSKNIRARVIHVMRSDILELIIESSNNLIKTVTDFGIEIDWYAESHKNPENHPLMQMIIHKVRNTIPQYKELDNKKIYNLIFNREEAILPYILNISFGRPREIVRYLDIVKRKYPDSSTINLQMLQSCQSDYSKWFYESMLSEIKINTYSEEIKYVLSLIRVRGSKRFTYSKLIKYANKKNDINLPPDLMIVLQEMFKLGILAILNDSGKIELYYRKNAPQTANEHTKFVVHNGFINYLNL